MVSSKPLFLIPIKDFPETKSRLRAALPAQQVQIVENLVEISLFYLIEVLNALSYNFGIISPSPRIIDKCKKLGAKFTFQDLGIDLNKAISDSVKVLPKDQPILIIMPDLPFLTQEFLQTFLNVIENEDVIIVPSISSETTLGTAILYLKHPDLLTFNFGKDSCLLFQKEAQKNGLKFRVLHFEPFARDLDTINDVKYLKSHLKMLKNSDRYIDVLKKV